MAFRLCWRMIPHKSKREATAVARLKVYEGIPAPYDKTKRMVIPDALKFAICVSLCKYHFTPTFHLREPERKRKERAQVSYERRKQLAKLRAKAEKAAEEKLGPQLEIIAPIKY